MVQRPKLSRANRVTGANGELLGSIQQVFLKISDELLVNDLGERFKGTGWGRWPVYEASRELKIAIPYVSEKHAWRSTWSSDG